jgi:hypothetical protein
VKISVTAILLLTAGFMPAQAGSLRSQLSQFCAKRYQVPVSEVGTYRTGMGLYTLGGPTQYERMTRTEWIDCFCKGQWCDCCEYDIAKACAFVAHRNATTKDTFRFSSCENG